MKLNKIMLAAVMAFGVSSLAHAANQGSGTVTFSGSIIDAPCSIAPESIDQTVELGAISNVALKNGSKASTPRDFHIQLEGCDLKTEAPGKNNTVTLTFNGTASETDKKLLAITGEAKGAGIAITDANKNLIELGKASNAIELQNGRNKLSFAAYLQGSSASDSVIVPGEFQAVADFTLAYQ
ncbi:type 1 fimbrial protein [Serratia marcescens]|uniref:Fimbrial protein n=1 Tax=Serratia marcescens SM39 TaxID=1334564 RepID=A0AAT9DYK8_SERMA|nr:MULTISPECIES: fimbrial protein [Serratia]AVE51385.1 type 1 fimbrial protein [Serratia marcescens]EMD6649145.1 type 1 fimbrial protein [Serratia marcescens]MBD8462424.1 type 1 fimbrial protein [Serratia marcescens]MBH2594775.1 type 1 fimbrial protein [Serratia marcescens]MBH2855395.1 type 1 fimbrial protein [Serratia marcescens]